MKPAAMAQSLSSSSSPLLQQDVVPDNQAVLDLLTQIEQSMRAKFEAINQQRQQQQQQTTDSVSQIRPHVPRHNRPSDSNEDKTTTHQTVPKGEESPTTRSEYPLHLKLNTRSPSAPTELISLGLLLEETAQRIEDEQQGIYRHEDDNSRRRRETRRELFACIEDATAEIVHMMEQEQEQDNKDGGGGGEAGAGHDAATTAQTSKSTVTVIKDTAVAIPLPIPDPTLAGIPPSSILSSVSSGGQRRPLAAAKLGGLLYYSPSNSDEEEEDDSDRH